MEKRISKTTKTIDGVVYYVAQVQVSILGCWLTVKTIEDTCQWYTEARAEECLYYMEDERYEHLKNRCQDDSQISARCSQAV